MSTGHVRFTVATREDAARVHGITQAAYAEYRGVLDPPSGVDRETLVDAERAIDDSGAVLAWIGDTAVGAVRFQHAADHLAVVRLAVIPTARGQGIARALLAYLEDLARHSHLPEAWPPPEPADATTVPPHEYMFRHEGMTSAAMRPSLWSMCFTHMALARHALQVIETHTRPVVAAMMHDLARCQPDARR